MNTTKKVPLTVIKKLLKYVVFGGVLSVILAAVAVYTAYHLWIVHGNLPNITELITTQKPNVVTRVYGFEGDVRQPQAFDQDAGYVEIGKIYNRLSTPVPLGVEGLELERSIIAAEDANFWQHNGVDWMAVTKSLFGAIRTLRLRGASTITMQLVKSVMGNERSLRRKFTEWYLAYQLEKNLAAKLGSSVAAKKAILTYYRDQVYIGQGGYGFQEAALRYFRKSSIDELTPFEASALAALAKGAERYTETRTRNGTITPEARLRWLARTRYVLRQRWRNHTLTDAEYAALLERPLIITPPRYETGVCAEFVALVAKKLHDMYGSALYETPLEVRTTCHLPTQRAARRLLEDHLKEIDSQNGQLPSPQASLVILDVRSGVLLALIGGNKYQAGDFVRAVESGRPAGSTAKILLYTAALEQGYRVTDGFVDEVFTLPPLKAGGKPWSPHNAHEMTGTHQSLLQSFARSLNTTTVQLGYDIGQNKKDPYAPLQAMQNVAERLGITSPIQQEYSSFLGVSDVRLVELAGALATIVRGGVYKTPHLFTALRAKSAQGGTWAKNDLEERQALAPEIAFLMGTMLREVVTHGTGVRAKSLPGWVVGKTGTSNDNNDAYFIGSTRDYTIASWMGYDKPMGLGMSTRTGKEIQGASLVPLFVKMVSELPGNVKTSVAPSPPPNVLRVASVPALFADGKIRPRCATPEDLSEQITEHYYLRTAVPELCPPEIASQPQTTPLGFLSTPSPAASNLSEEAKKPLVVAPIAPPTSVMPDLGVVSKQPDEDEDRPWRSTPKIEE